MKKKLLIILGITAFLVLLFGYILLPQYAVPPSINRAMLYSAVSDCKQMIDVASIFYKEKGRPPKIEEIQSLYPFNRSGPGATARYLLYFEGVQDGVPRFSAACFMKYGVAIVQSDKNWTIKESK